MPKFSIIVPIYNVEKYLNECLDSVISQDFSDYELILVNDGSTDNSYNIICDYKAKYPSITVINQKNCGAGYARQVGIEKASGEYVLVLDSDDYLSNGLLLRLNGIIEKYNPDIIKLNYREFSEDKKTDVYSKYLDKFFSGEDMKLIKEELLYDKNTRGLNMGIGSYTIWSTISKRELITMHQTFAPKKIRLGDDVAVTIPMIYNANSIYFTDTIDYFYRSNQNSIVNTFKSDELQRIEILIRYLENALPENKKNDVYVYALKMVTLYTSFASKKLNKIEFLDWAKSEINEYLFEKLSVAKVNKLTQKEKIKTRLIKLKKYKLFWLLIH